MPIQLLPISLANQIAAGEVIERPASVVKELVENSLDAGADQIIIDIEKGGRRRIRIRDNGSGITKDELPLALSRHATSKISSLDDLEAILSLGFRGEALASISSVARLKLQSKTAAQTEAWEAWVEGRDMTAELAPCRHETGSTVDVCDLFFNTPARRKFLRTDKTEFSHIEEVVRRIALSRLDVDFRLNQNGKQVRHYAKVTPDNALKRVAQVCGTTFAEQAIAISATETSAFDLKLEGWIAPPEACRHQPDVQYFYVNGRMMRDRLLQHAIRQAYGDLLLEDRNPTYVLYLDLPATEVDVNVHPAKHEVRFQQARFVHDFVLQCLKQMLQQAPQSQRAEHQYQAAPVDLSAQIAELKPKQAEPLPSAAPTTKAGVLAVLRKTKALIIDTQERLFLLDLKGVQQNYLARQIQQQLTTGLAGQPLLVPVQITGTDAERIQATDLQVLARHGVMLKQQRNAVTIQQVPSALRNSNIAKTIPELCQRLNEPEQVAAWLAGRQVASYYTLVQAEHWWQVWQEQLNSEQGLVRSVTLPE